MLFIYSKNGGTQKPTDAKPYQTKKNYVWGDLPIREIAEKVGTGHAWRAGVYDEKNGNTFKKNEVLGANIIALDFDNCEKTPEEVVAYAVSIGFTPNIWYYSFSQGIKPNNNFRIMWMLEQGITPKAYEEIYKAVLASFEDFGPDEATKDCSRMWYGGKHAEIISEDPIKMSDCGWLAIVDKARQGIELRKAIKGQKAGLPDYAELDIPDRVSVRCGKPWWECLRGRCYLWDKWQNGEYLDYNQRLTLFTNLKFLTYSDNSGSHSIIKDTLQFYKPEVYEGHSFNEEQLRKMMLDRTLRPVPIVKSKNYKKIDSSNGDTNTNISTTDILEENTEKINKSDFLTVPDFFRDCYNDCSLIGIHNDEPTAEALDAWFKENFVAFLNTNGLTYLQCQTGAGKTEAMINYLASEDLTNKKVIYAVPHFNLIQEFGERYAKSGGLNEVHLLPKRALTEEDKDYYALGLPPKTQDVRRSKFIREMNGATGGLWVITHALLVRLYDIDTDLIVIDENIEDALFRTTKISDTALSSVATFLGGKDGHSLNQFINQLRTLKQGETIDLSLMKSTIPAFSERIEEFIATHNTSTMPNGYFYCGNVQYGKRGHKKNEVCVRITEKTPLIKTALNKGIPVKIMTATPMPARVANGYGVEIKVFKAPHCKNRGKIIQYTAKTGARGLNNANLPSLMEYAKSIIPDGTDIITFKDADKYLGEKLNWQLARLDGDQIHFNNCAGLDAFRGKSIAIVGKFDRPAEYYEELWEDIGDGSELTMNNHTVMRNGVKQTLYLYDEPRIREEQLDYINMVVAQASGRARALREENATVYIFCNFIIEDVDEIH